MPKYAKGIGATLVSWRKSEGNFPVMVKIRYRHDPAPATVEVKGMKARVIFDEAQFAAAHGQIAVFSKGDRVVGIGKIDEALKSKFLFPSIFFDMASMQ
jgi:tRNA-specific 2-thiouridylase